MSSPIRDAQIKADRTARVNYKQAIHDAAEAEKLADPAYQALVAERRAAAEEREAYWDDLSKKVSASWDARFRERFPNAPIPGSAEAKAWNPNTIIRDSGVMGPLAEVRNQAYQNTGTLPPNTQLLMPNGTIRSVASAYPQYMDKQMEKVSEDIFDYYKEAGQRAKAGLAAYREAWKPAPEYDTGLSFSETIEKDIADAFERHGMSRTRTTSPWQKNADSPRFGVATSMAGGSSDLTWFEDAMAKRAAPILAATADVRARHREPKYISSLSVGSAPARMTIGFKDGGLGAYPYSW